MRCYFHLVNSPESIPDDTGIEVSDLTKAEEMALQAIEDIREEAIQQGASWQGWRLDIVDRSGLVLLSIPLDPTFHWRPTMQPCPTGWSPTRMSAYCRGLARAPLYDGAAWGRSVEPALFSGWRSGPVCP
jgi:hypothetical protein